MYYHTILVNEIWHYFAVHFYNNSLQLGRPWKDVIIDTCQLLRRLYVTSNCTYTTCNYIYKILIMHCKKEALEVMHNSVTFRKLSNISIGCSLWANSPSSNALYVWLSPFTLCRFWFTALGHFLGQCIYILG